MDKGVKKMIKLDKQINKYNKEIIDKAVKRARKFKGMSLSEIRDDSEYVTEVLINKCTRNHETTIEFMESLCKEKEKLYPYLTIKTDPYKENGKKRKLIAENDNRLLIIIDVHKYRLHEGLKVSSGFSSNTNILNLGSEQRFMDMNRRNEDIIRRKLAECLSKERQYSKDNETDFPVDLVPETLFNVVTRNHFKMFAQGIIESYGNVVQIFNLVGRDTAIIRINWKLHRAQVAERLESVPLIMQPLDLKPKTKVRKRKVHTPDDFTFPYPPQTEPSFEKCKIEAI